MRNIKKKKILFGITSLTLGGAERVLVDLANELCDIYDITIFSIYDGGELKKELKEKIKFKTLYRFRYDQLSKLQKLYIPVKLLVFSNYVYKRRIKGDYDCEIAFLEGPITRLFSNKNKCTKKIAWIHNDISKVFGNNFKALLKRIIDNTIYKRYDNLVFVSNDNMDKFKEMYKGIDACKMRVIYNYINKENIIKKSNIDCDFSFGENKCLLSICRLVKQKRIDRFIRVHQKLIDSGIYHKVFIIGDGPEMDRLSNLIRDLHVEETFILLGKKENPYPYIKDADYFCLLSEYEGYGMVLKEAKILNKKIIITDTAAREVVKGYNKAIIVKNDEESIYETLRKALLSDELSEELDNKEVEDEDEIKDIIDLVGD